MRGLDFLQKDSHCAIFPPFPQFVLNFYAIFLLIDGKILITGSGTPVRKISAHEFERGGLTKPLVTTVDGSPTFLSPPHSSNGDGVDSRGQLIRKRSRNDMLFQ